MMVGTADDGAEGDSYAQMLSSSKFCLVAPGACPPPVLALHVGCASLMTAVQCMTPAAPRTGYAPGLQGSGCTCSMQALQGGCDVAAKLC